MSKMKIRKTIIENEMHTHDNNYVRIELYDGDRKVFDFEDGECYNGGADQTEEMEISERRFSEFLFQILDREG